MSEHATDGSSEILVLLRPNGTVSGGSAEVPTTWLERRLEASLVGDAVAEACDEACRQAIASGSGFRRSEAEVGGRPRTLLLVAQDALPLRRSLVRVAELVLGTFDLFVTQARSADVELHLQQDDDLPPVLYGDGEKLAWVLATLVGNAVRIVTQAAPRGVSARVELEARFDRERKEMIFVVADNGPGMPESTSRWLFERDPGTGRAVGLALMMVHDVVAAHQGTIEVASSMGKGTRFTVRIPKGQARA
jgi:signal transduction histidine kinase